MSVRSRASKLALWLSTAKDEKKVSWIQVSLVQRHKVITGNLRTLDRDLVMTSPFKKHCHRITEKGHILCAMLHSQRAVQTFALSIWTPAVFSLLSTETMVHCCSFRALCCWYGRLKINLPCTIRNRSRTPTRVCPKRCVCKYTLEHHAQACVQRLVCVLRFDAATLSFLKCF